MLISDSALPKFDISVLFSHEKVTFKMLISGSGLPKFDISNHSFTGGEVTYVQNMKKFMNK